MSRERYIKTRRASL